MKRSANPHQPLASTPEGPGAPKVRRAAERIKAPFKASNNTGWKGLDSGSAVTRQSCHRGWAGGCLSLNTSWTKTDGLEGSAVSVSLRSPPRLWPVSSFIAALVLPSNIRLANVALQAWRWNRMAREGGTQTEYKDWTGAWWQIFGYQLCLQSSQAILMTPVEPEEGTSRAAIYVCMCLWVYVPLASYRYYTYVLLYTWKFSNEIIFEYFENHKPFSKI